MQEGDGVGDMHALVLLGVEKGQQVVADHPPPPKKKKKICLKLFSSTSNLPTHPALSFPILSFLEPAGTTVYLGGNIVTSGVV